MTSLSQLFSFLARHARHLKILRGTVPLVIGAGILGGLASTGLVVTINFTLSRSLPRNLLVTAFSTLCLLLPLLRSTSTVLLLRLTQTVLRDLRLHLARRILAAPLRQLEEIGPAKLLATLTEDVGTIAQAVGSLPLALMHGAVVVGCLAFLCYLSWSVFLLVLGFLLLGVITFQLPRLRAQRIFSAMREAWDQLFRGLRGITDGTKELKIHAPRRAAFVTGQLEPAAEELRRTTVRGNTIYALAASWGQALFFVVIGLILFVVPLFRPVAAPTASGFVLVLLYLITPLDVILSLLPGFSRAAVAIAKVESLGLSLREQGADAPATAVPPALPAWARIELRSVRYAFRRETDDSSFLLGPLDLALRPGELLFVTGGNGSGKTTLAKLLIGLYAPESGEVRLDGRPVTDGDRDRYRQLFSVVFADFYLFDTLLGLDGSDLDRRAARYLASLQLAEKVTISDASLSTLALSQGQRKRLALLTAYLEDRPIYVFDEWAADQDPFFREVFYTQLLPELQARGKTLVVISHDDRYYALADRIVKLENGMIAYDGRSCDLGVAPPAPQQTPGARAAAVT
jgi:putative ATP-binding cassette transporter